jgi:cytidylate kinase
MEPADCAIIAIDGPAGSGKTTLARGLARELGMAYLGTGATYRALALKALREGLDPMNDLAAMRLARSAKIEILPDPEGEQRVLLDGEDVTDQLAGNPVSVASSIISRHTDVRRTIVELQRALVARFCESAASGEGAPTLAGVIVEGRDIGTVVFPDAVVKIYLDAGLEERARRRLADFKQHQATLPEAMESILRRDVSDIQRSASPLKPAPDAIIIDNTNWPVEKTLSHALKIIRERLSSSRQRHAE